MDLKYLTVLAYFNALVYCNHYLCKISQIQSLVQYLEGKKKKKFWTFSKITRVVTLKTFSSRYYKF